MNRVLMVDYAYDVMNDQEAYRLSHSFGNNQLSVVFTDRMEAEELQQRLLGFLGTIFKIKKE